MRTTPSIQLILLILIILICMLSTIKSANAEPQAALVFSDINNESWAYATILWALSQQITTGFEDQTFRPNEAVTEEQFLALLIRAFQGNPTGSTPTHWSDPYYATAKAHHYPLSKSRSTIITRKYAAELLSSTQGVHFDDKYAIQYLLDHNLSKGVTSQTIPGFQGNNLLTRAEALQFIRNLLNNTEPAILKDRPLTPSDLSTLHMPALPVERLHALGNAEQAILVTAPKYGTIAVKITAYEKINGKWSEKWSAKPGVIGLLGFSPDFHEGDRTTPEGIFTLKSSFGKYKNPGTMLPYRQANSNDYWVDDARSAYYNTWQTGPVKGRWSSAEHLLRKDKVYDYAVVIDYNTARIPGKGSAIFLHIWSSPASGTLGCTAMKESDLLAIMRWLDPSKHPIIIQGTDASVANF